MAAQSKALLNMIINLSETTMQAYRYYNIALYADLYTN